MIRKEITKNLPSTPGVYIFKNDDGQPLYVGKAKNLRKRIEQYFQNDSLKIKKLLQSSADIEIIQTKSEIEAIFRESDLIKKLNPPFNQLLRDDSRYFYIVFSEEIFPKIIITHQPEKFSAQEIIGPFFEGTVIQKILSLVRKNLPFCTCKQKHTRPCLNAQIGLCFGWCCLENEQPSKKQIKIYRSNLKLLKKIFVSDLTLLKKNLLQKIKNALKKNDLNLATQLKNFYLSLKKIEENQNLIKDGETIFIEHENKKILLKLKEIFSLKKTPHLIEVYDISHFSGKEMVGIVVSFLDGVFQSSLTKKFNIKTLSKPDDPRMIYEIIKRRLAHKEWGIPDLILVDGGKIQFNFAQLAISESKSDIDLLSLSKPKNEIYSTEGKKNLDSYPLLKNFIINLDRKAHILAINYHRQKRESKFKPKK
ncbi:MAG: GIY-YIG nuclease family protein [Patescibacteria group bacterium]|nr:GIY-YIG nuclease family protein [Patescibacteria group bacterium]